MRVLMTGGGTMGPVTPLLAIAEAWQVQDPSVEVRWIGTPGGPEREVVQRRGYTFTAAKVPKLDRARPWKLPLLPLALLRSLYVAWKYLRAERPDWILSAGGFVSVPYVVMGRLLKINTWVHQLDVQPLLANKIMSPFATRLSTTWPESATSFAPEKTVTVGAVIRQEVLLGRSTLARERFGLREGMPTVLLIGGGTGALALNQAAAAVAAELAGVVNVVHVTGKGKVPAELREPPTGYAVAEYLDSALADVYALADVVVGRAGMGTIMELIALGKPAILLPLAGHQEVNAARIVQAGAADILTHLTPQTLFQAIRRVALDEPRAANMGHAMHSLAPTNGAQEIVTFIAGL
jgi:UDP-N-acetylglucosamine--N-acetylmuramyl-(pentapeptide) pyrophosphoryl-undecaprenol N-acetylglucosamine transferase